MKDDRKIASSDTTSVRKVKGYGSKCGKPGMTFQPIHSVKITACAQTKRMLPQKRATSSAARSARERCRSDNCSSLRIACTFSRVRSSTLRGRR